ncbi:MAG: MarR family winged helix-turn-helix transcriptional regulator [Christensenellales bacterium]|jgi:DNA-binding MarR family transcriptional regulator|nr:winged helix DNA-binding protein [Chloroflexota bacterium]
MPTIQEFWKDLKSVLSLARLAVNERLSQLDLASAAGDVIFHLTGEEFGLTQEELCERLNIGKAAISRTVDSLVLKGFVQRMKHPRDARAYLVSLTKKGLGISTRVSEAYDNVFQVIQRDISREELLNVSLLLNRIQNNLVIDREKE